MSATEGKVSAAAVGILISWNTPRISNQTPRLSNARLP